MDKNELDETAEEIVNMIVSSKKLSEKSSSEEKISTNELDELKRRVDNLEKLLQKYIDSFKIVAVEVERQITEKHEEQMKDNERTLMLLIEQIENLKAEIRAVKLFRDRAEKH